MYSDPGISIGRLLPEASGSPSSILITFIPFTHPFHRRGFLWIGKKIELYAFFFCVMYFFYSCRKLCFTTTIYDMYFCAKTKCCSGSIHSYVTTTDNGYFLACCDWCIKNHRMPSSGYFLSGIHLQRTLRCCLARDSHEHWKSCSGTDEYSFKIFLFHQLVDGCRFTDDNICLEFNA